MSPSTVGFLLYIIVSATLSHIRSRRGTRLQRIPKLETRVRLPSTAFPITYCGEKKYEFRYRKYRRDSSPAVAPDYLPVSTAINGGITIALLSVSDFDGLPDRIDRVEVFYNRKRRHEHLGRMSPVEYEEKKLAA
jgi:transposase InsO family protein